MQTNSSSARGFLRARTAGFSEWLQAPALALTLSALFWSGNFVVGRTFRGHVDPVALNFARWLLALALLLPFFWRSAWESLPVLRRHWLLIAGLGATGIATFHTMVYVSLQTTTAINALLTLLLTPVAILTGAVLAGIERPLPRQLLGVAVSIAGAVVLVTHGEPSALLRLQFGAGDLWMLAAVVVWAIYSMLLRQVPARVPQGAVLTASIAAGLILLAPFLLFSSSASLGEFASVPIFLGVGYVALFSSVIAFLFWSYGVRELGPTRAGQFIYLMPLFGAALAAVTLQEIPTLSEIAGGALVLAGIVAVERRV